MGLANRLRAGAVTGSIALLIAFFGAVSQVAAQQQEASIIGLVTDESGAVLPGVVVTAASPALQLPQMTAVTTERGEYHLTPLPIGTYEVTYSLDGFQSIRREGIRLTAGFAAKIDVQLKVGGVNETITVSGASPVVDVTSTRTSTQLTRETLELLPTSRNSSSGLMAQTPGARPALDVGGETMQSPPVFRAFGQTGESWQSVEGINTTNPKTGNQGGNYWDYASFEEAVVVTMGHDASTPTRGIQINALYKSGGNDFRGGGFVALTNRGLQSGNVDDALKAQGIRGTNATRDRWDASGELGGRILRDRIWFYVSGRDRGEHIESLDGLGADGEPAVSTGGNRFGTGKLTYQMSQTNRFVVFNTWAQKTRVNDGVTALTPWESRIDQRLAHHTSKVEWQWVKGTSLVSTVQMSSWKGGTGSGHWTGHTSKTPTTDLATLANTGASTSAGQRTDDHQIGPAWNLTYFKPDLFIGDHNVKAGVQYQDSQSDRPWVIGEGGNYQLIFRNQIPTQIAVWNYPVTPKNPIHYLSSWVQDSWAVNRRLTLNLGLRYAYDHGFIPEQCREEAAPAPAQLAGPVQCFQARDFNTWNRVVPRIRAAYDLRGNGKTVIKGGWGRYAPMRKVDELQQANPNVATTTTYLWHDLNGNLTYEPGEVNLDLNGPDFVTVAVQGGGGAALANGIPNPNEKAPTDDEVMLSLEHELMQNFAVRLTGVRSWRTDTYRLQNSLRPPSTYTVPVTNTDPGPDGRVGSADDPGTVLTYWEYPQSLSGAAFQKPWLVNDRKADASFSSFEVAGSKRLSNRWQLMASFSATKKDIPIIQNAGSSNGLVLYIATDDPNAEINNADRTWEWLGRAEGAYLLPFDALFSVNFEHRSGDALARTVLLRGGRTIPNITLKAEQLGSFRLPNINLLDLRVEKSVRFSNRQKITGRMNVFNAMNVNTVTSVTTLSGADFMKARSIVSGRIVEFSAAYSF
jgi:hypothetical protein